MRFWWQVLLCFCLYFGFCKSKISSYKSKPLLTDTIMHYPDKKIPSVYIKIYVDNALTRKLLPKINADVNATDFRRTFKNVTRKIVEDAELMLSHRSLDENIKIVLLDTRFLKHNALLTTENASKYLRSFCEWQINKKILQKRWYFSVLLTGLDIYVKTYGGIDKTSTGRGYINSMCNPTRSCTLLEWHPQNVPYLLAHELAHSMGVNHDGPPNNPCPYRGYMMTHRYSSGTHPKVWSPCSRKELKQYLKLYKIGIGALNWGFYSSHSLSFLKELIVNSQNIIT